MGKFIKKYRYTLILLLVFVLLCVLALKVKEDDVYSKILEEFEKDDKVLKIDHRLQGKILNYYITVDDKLSVKDAKGKGEKVISLLDDDILSYYSVQLYLIKNDETLNNFPIIGLKDPLSKTISWTKDREIVVANDEE